jgi:cytochrome b involved in lipid metabolism
MANNMPQFVYYPAVLDQIPGFPKSPTHVSEHSDGFRNYYIVFNGAVYDVTNYMWTSGRKIGALPDNARKL